MPHSVLPVIRSTLLFVTLAVGSVQGQDPTLYLEDFDAVSPPDLPTGWTSTPGGVWASSPSVPSPGSGGNNLVISGGDSGHVVTPALDFTALSSGEISYLARRTSTFPVTGLTVEASTDGGVTFSVVVIDSTAAVPATPSEYTVVSSVIPPALIGSPTVQFRIRAFGSGGGNCRIDDISISGVGTVGLTSFGFRSSSSLAAFGADSFRVDLSLTATAAIGELHGLQFDIAWPLTETVVAVERGPAVSDINFWELTAQITSSPGRIVLISTTESGLPPGTYEDLLTLVLHPLDDGGSARDDTLSITNIIGSRSTDTGDDAYVTAGELRHVISVLPAVATFSVSPDSLDLGVVEIDSMSTGSLVVTNPLGNVDLDVTVSATIAGLDLLPAAFSVAPGDSTDVLVTADGSTLPVGPFGGYAVFTHNASAEPDSVWVFGRVGSASSRGDVNNDGVTDLLDLVLSVDHVVGLDSLETQYADRVDLYPFPDGDGSVDVRDLTVLVKAINSGIWPDGILLPAPITAAKTAGGQRAKLHVIRLDGSGRILVDYAPGLRALHLLIQSSSGLATVDLEPPDHGQFVQTHIDEYYGGGNSVIGVLAYTLDGGLSSAAEFVLTDVRLAESDSLQVIYASGVDLMNRRVNIEFSRSELPQAGTFDIRPPFPQPFSISKHGRLIIQSESLDPTLVSVTVGDVLGRVIYSANDVSFSRASPFSWDGKTLSGETASPGMYFVRLRSEHDEANVPVIILK